MVVCRGSEVLREVAWVIFDEVHYMQDRERGVVWEETIITLPPQIRMVFLSATLANATEFASWVAHLHKRPCHVVYTDFRPTPLQHYGFPQGGNGLYLVGFWIPVGTWSGFCFVLLRCSWMVAWNGTWWEPVGEGLAPAIDVRCCRKVFRTVRQGIVILPGSLSANVLLMCVC